jgi:RNA polymerase sigma-70 factor (ECF subfamily)
MKLQALSSNADDSPSRKVGCQALLRALRAGSPRAIIDFYDSNHQRVRALARRLLGDAAAAEDVVQEVFASLPRALRHYRGEADLPSFLLGIAVKKARDHLRAAIRRRRVLERYAFEERVGPRDPEQDMYQKEMAHRMTLALDQISVAHREAFILCQVEGLAAAQAAVILGIPEATVRTRLFHCRARLQKLFEDEVAR